MDTAHPNLLSIGAFATASHLSLKALRLYDQKGLLLPAYTDPGSGYRYYRTEQLRQAKLIGLMRQMEMPLAKIRSVLAAVPAEAEDMVLQYQVSVETRAEQSRRASGELLALLQNRENLMSHTVSTKELPAQLVVSISAGVRIDGLHRHICDTVAALYAFTENQGGKPTGAPLGIFHGPINHDDDGPIEICLPVEGRFAAQSCIVVKELSGGTFASVTVRGPECDFPAILGAYDAASDWIQRQGFDMAGAPREIWHKAPPDGEMEIAWQYHPRA